MKYIPYLIIFLLIGVASASPTYTGIVQKNNSMNYTASPNASFGVSFDAAQVNSISAATTPIYPENSPYDINTTGLVAWWKFDEGNGIYANDSSGNNINGTLQNGVAWGDGKYNNAGVFDNSNDQVSYSSSKLKINDTMTICCVVNPHGCIQGRILYDPNGNVSLRNYVYYISTSYHPGIQVANGAKTDSVTSTLIMRQNDWNFVAIAINGTKIRFFVNAQAETLTLPYNISANYSTNINRVTGGTTASSVLNGSMDQLIIYDRTLSDNEINQIRYDTISELQFKTNSNDTYGDPSNIPFSTNDAAITGLTAHVPENVTIGGVTVRDYSRSITPFSLSTNVTYHENAAVLDESATNGTFKLNMSFTPSFSYLPGGLLAYATSGTKYIDTVNINSNDTGASSTFVSPDFIVTTGGLTSGWAYRYNLSGNFATELSPIADFAANVTAGMAPLPVLFIDNSTNVPTSWYWDFGDNTTGAGYNPAHKYMAAGTYTVNLTVANSGGNNTTIKTGYITVEANPLAPIANFTATGTNGTEPITVAFSDLSTGYITDYHWYFGDGWESTERSPTYTYPVRGNYTVTLIVSSPNGDSSKTMNITVLPAPVEANNILYIAESHHGELNSIGTTTNASIYQIIQQPALAALIGSLTTMLNSMWQLVAIAIFILGGALVLKGLDIF